MIKNNTRYNCFIILLVVVFSNLCDMKFAHYAMGLKEKFKISNIKSDFGKRCYKVIKKATFNFNENLDFDALERVVPNVFLDFIAREIIYQNKKVYVALVWPVCEEKDSIIENILYKYCNILYKKRILFSKESATIFLSQIRSKKSHPQGVNLWFQEPYSKYNPLRVYLVECKDIDVNLEEMRSYLSSVFSNNKKYIGEIEDMYGIDALKNLYITTKCKREIRKAVGIEYAMHINDFHFESIEVGNIVFNENSIDFIKNSKCHGSNFNNFKRFMNDLKYKYKNFLDSIVIYNSAVLSAYGLRDCSDIDFLHDPRVVVPRNLDSNLSNQNMYFKRGYVIIEDYMGKHFILEDSPQAYNDLNLDDAKCFRVKISIDDLLFNPEYYFYYDGIKYATIKFMHYFKNKRGRPKDIKDVRLMEEFFVYSR